MDGVLSIEIECDFRFGYNASEPYVSVIVRAQGSSGTWHVGSEPLLPCARTITLTVRMQNHIRFQYHPLVPLV